MLTPYDFSAITGLKMDDERTAVNESISSVEISGLLGVMIPKVKRGAPFVWQVWMYEYFGVGSQLLEDVDDMFPRFLHWLPKYCLSAPPKHSLQAWRTMIDSLAADDMSLNPWLGCEEYVECAWAQELNGRQVLFECRHGRYWYLGDWVLAQLADLLANEEIARARVSHVVLGTLGDYLEFVQAQLEGYLADIFGTSVGVDLVEESMQMIRELCPTIEEFLAILGYEPGKKSVAVSCDPKHREILFDALGLPTSITSSMIEGQMVNLHIVVTRLINKRTHGVSNNMQKNFGLALCFMGEFLLCTRRPGFMDARTIGIVSQIKDGDNSASLVFTETLLGLDSVFLGGEF
ncbi:hypothetical protein SO802_023310 [Lithocarpus litseifolius]|uniref:Uncharacterized protein n=1 Tax=Lithocarpus litseifolius TaxID=425828 RepID=A0AAW2C7U1_9ROSI